MIRRPAWTRGWRARLPRGRQAVVTVVALVVAAVALGLLVGPAVLDRLGPDDADPSAGIDERFLDYCEEVQRQQRPLSEAMEAGAGGLIAALPSFEALGDEAPEDIADDWDVVVGRVQDLVDALDAADVDPDEYDAEDPPKGVTPEQRRAIEAAARRLVADETVNALDSVQQQARDVCKTPLTL